MRTSLLPRCRLVLPWTLASLRYHALRTALTALAIGLATAFVASTLGLRAGYEAALDRDVQGMGYQVLVTGKGCPHEAATLILRGGTIPMYLQESVARAVAARPEVADSTRFLMQVVPGPDAGTQQVHVGIDADFLRLKPDVSFQRGGWFSSESAPEALLGYNVAEYRRLGQGDSIEVRGTPLAVRGVLDRLGTQDDGMVFLPLAVAQDLFELPDRLTGMGLRLHDPTRAAEFIDRLYEIPSIQVVRMATVQRTILRILGGVQALLLAFSALAVGLAMLGVFNVGLLVASERRREMGVLRALGCPARTLFALVLSEALAVAVAGTAVGVALAGGAAAGVDWALRAALPFVPSGPVVHLAPGLLLATSAVVVTASLLAGLPPAWLSARVPPLASIRGPGR